MGLRFLALIALVAIVFLMVKRKLADKSARTEKAAPPATQEMAQCGYCGVFLPKKEAITKMGKQYCCDAHAALDEQAPK